MMNLEQLLAGVKGLQDDSRRVQAGDLFFAMPGSVRDGNAFALAALDKGAVRVVSEQSAPAGFESRWVQVADVVALRLQAARAFYGNPFERLECHGITGTNGKTTTAFLMDAVLRAAGRKVALLGTICKRIGDEEYPSDLTTPGLLELYAFAAQAVAAGCSDLVMEVSSHSLDQGRVAGLGFRSALFSNLTQDHLDYHKTMDAYFAAKRLLFVSALAKDGVAVINVDDAHGLALFQEIAPMRETVAVSRVGSYLAPNVLEKVDYTEDGLALTMPVLGEKPFTTTLCGEFNADNVLLVAGWVLALCLPVVAFRKALTTVRVPGRFEMVWNDGARRVVVDYAHTPDALERVLATARSLCKGRLHVVFGCGGDRDKGKRPLMGAIAERLADQAWVTSDNPRTEEPTAILQDIVAGMHPGKFQLVSDRAQAIRAAASAMAAGDWLVIAGKGHEDYQIVGTVKAPFDDRKHAVEAMQAC